MKKKFCFKYIITLFLVLICSSLNASADSLYKSNVTASYYADKFHGRKTSNGEVFNMWAMTAAHKTLPFNTVLRVTNLSNGKSVVVRINDRGPFVKGREIDLSKGAAAKIGMIKSGTAKVSLTIIKNSDGTVPGSKWKAPSVSSENMLWDIQMGAFSKEENAAVLAKRLRSYGYDVAYQKGNGITKVVIRAVPTAKVKSVLSGLEKRGFTDYYVKERKVK